MAFQPAAGLTNINDHERHGINLRELYNPHNVICGRWCKADQRLRECSAAHMR